MKLYDVKAGADRDDAAEAAVHRFFGHLVRRQPRRAGAECIDTMQWFGRPVVGADWDGEPFARYLAQAPLTFEKVRAFPRSVWSALAVAPETVFEGAVQDGDEVYLVDMARGAPPVTVGVLVRAIEGAWRVARVFDPEALKRAAASAGAGEQ
ncbi:MAG: hypothetical protein KC933_06305 [Myxococcales bacterium]|nr:hypothetical protein [Myxococcales bacterium]MCB9649980.1 hypothetical protein [Deltaproteobacteria bacterium]